MHAATLSAIIAAPQPSGGQDADAPASDPAKPGSDSASGGVDAFSQALAAMMGVASGPAAPVAPTTTSGGGQAESASSVALAPRQTFVLPANDQGKSAPENLAAATDPTLSMLIEAAGAATTTALNPQEQPAAPAPLSEPKIAVTPVAPAGGGAGPALTITSLSATLVTAAAGAASSNPPPVAAPQVQPPTAADGTGMPIVVALDAPANAAAMVLQPSSGAPAKPATAPTSMAKGTLKSDAPFAVASSETASTASADRPAVVAIPPNPADAAGGGDRNTRSTADASTGSSGAQSTANGNESSNLSALSTGVALQAPLQIAAASLAAANGAAIVGQLATQVAKNVDGKSTRFDVALDPAGLGHVDVKVEINAQGQVSAQFSFDNAHAAAEARSQSGQLQQALEQAGFNVSQGGLSFDVGGQGAGLAQQNTPQPQPTASTATVPDTTPIAPPTLVAANAPRPSGVDITI